MLLGIVLHGSLPYFSRMAGFESIWPADDDQSTLLFLVFEFIHTWRMPTFFLLAGFFAHLVLDRRSTSAFVLDRLKRIALPLALFGAIMAVIIPPIWVYGWYGVISLEIFRDVLKERQDLDSSGELVAHLWFLYYLLLLYAALIAFRLLGGLRRAQAIVRPAGRLPLGACLGNAVYARIPLLLILGAVLLLVLRAGNESKPIWPLNVMDVLYGALFFFYGYGLYARRKLIDRLRGSGTLAALWAIAAVVFFVHLALIGAIDEASKQERGRGNNRVPVAGRDRFLRGVGGLVQHRVGRALRAASAGAPPVGPLACRLVVLGIHHPSAGGDLPDVLSRPPRQAGLAEVPDGLQLERGAEVLGSVRCDRSPRDCDVPVPG